MIELTRSNQETRIRGANSLEMQRQERIQLYKEVVVEK